MAKHIATCTSFLAGKDATIDGSLMVGRNVDTFGPIDPQKVKIYPAYHNERRVVKSYLNRFEGEVPTSGYHYQGVPNLDSNFRKEGVFDESGFNEKGVGMSATESVYANERVLAIDPLDTERGVNEDVIVAMTLPYADSARDAVTRLGEVIAKYGSAEGNGVAFVDENDIWYMEIVTGHHWVAQRIPDDAYAVTGNRVAIQQVNFDDPQNFMWSKGIQEFVSDNNLNPDKHGWDFRHIFGTATTFDTHYNTPRQWYGHLLMNPDQQFEPTDFDLPFISRTDHKITLEDMQTYLGSHYENTPYDPLGKGSADDKVRFRPIGLNRTQNSHVLQVNPAMPKYANHIMWLCLGVPTFTPYVPFFSEATSISQTYAVTPTSLNMNLRSAYWMYRVLSETVESYYSEFLQDDLDYLKAAREYLYRWVKTTAQRVADEGMDREQANTFLSDEMAKMNREMGKRTKELLSKLLMNGMGLSKLTFKMDENL